MTNCGEHRNVGFTVGKRTRLPEVNVFLRGVFANTACFFIFSQQGRKYSPCRDVIPEFETVANDLFKPEMKRDGAYREIERTGYQNIAVAEVARRVDEGLRLRKNRRFDGHFEQIVGKADQPVAVHSTVRSKRDDVEKRP